MNLHDAAAVTLATPAPIFAAPYDALDDAALLAHFRGPRDVHVDLVVDADECTPHKIDALLDGRFEFNGEPHVLPTPIDWLANPSADVEWHILLHKFYYAPGLGQAFLAGGDVRYAERWAALIDGWMRVTPPGFIAADVTGRRVQNWIYSLTAFVNHRAAHEAPVAPAFLRRMLQSLHEQVELLCANLTPKRNHRTLELYAIFLAGVALPEMARAAHWREFALRETLVNLRADLLSDGVHCELSSDYHHLALRNWMHVRTLAARHGVAVPAEMDTLLERALEFGLHVHQPDGGMPSLSDGDARGYLPLLAWGAQQYGRADLQFVATRGTEGEPPAARNGHFDASGYHVLRTDWRVPPTQAQHLVFDCGPLGEGNHGHFDALSFELFGQGRPLLVDPGRYTYSEAGAVNWRVHFRGTAAHNTVCVDGRPQTRYEPKAVKEASRHASGSVRHKIAGPAPDTSLVERVDRAELDLLHGRCASHAYDAVHERCIVFVDQRYWIVSDALRAPTEHDYLLTFQLGAGLDATLHDGQLVCPGLRIAQPVRNGERRELAEGWVSARYGHKQAAPALRTHVRGRDVDFDTVLVPGADAGEPLAVTSLAVPGARDALRIRLGPHTDGWFHAGARAGRWQLGELEFLGRWLHWRCDADGRVLRAISHAGASLRGPHGPLPLTVVGAGA